MLLNSGRWIHSIYWSNFSTASPCRAHNWLRGPHVWDPWTSNGICPLCNKFHTVSPPQRSQADTTGRSCGVRCCHNWLATRKHRFYPSVHPCVRVSVRAALRVESLLDYRLVYIESAAISVYMYWVKTLSLCNEVKLLKPRLGYATACPITAIHCSPVSGMHHYECVAPNVDINLQSGRFWAMSIASLTAASENSNENM